MTVMFNSEASYGALTKFFHWLIALLFVLQYASALIMIHVDAETTTFGARQDFYYNWHKSLGLVILLLVVGRILNRKVGQLPAWAPALSSVEKIIIHRAEQLLYTAMLVMPLSGLLFVMAGDYGIVLFGRVPLPNPIGAWPALASLARWIHISTAILLLLPLGVHLGIVFGHHFGLADGLISRMLPRSAGRRLK